MRRSGCMFFFTPDISKVCYYSFKKTIVVPVASGICQVLGVE